MFHRAAFECEDKVVRMVVLCSGCLSEMLEQAPDNNWVRSMGESGECEFCQHQIVSEVGATASTWWKEL